MFQLRLQIILFLPPQNQQGDRDQYQNGNTGEIGEYCHQRGIVEQGEKYANGKGYPNGVRRRIIRIRFRPKLRHENLLIFAQTFHEFRRGHDRQESRIKHDEESRHVDCRRPFARRKQFIQLCYDVVTGACLLVSEHTDARNHYARI